MPNKRPVTATREKKYHSPRTNSPPSSCALRNRQAKGAEPINPMRNAQYAEMSLIAVRLS
jgi:hypothetical protein